MKYFCLLILLFSYPNAKASLPETFGQKSVLRERSKIFGFTDITTQNTRWKEAYTSFSTHLSYGKKKHIQTLGFTSSIESTENQRSGGYYRYDYFHSKESSLSIKYIHQDWFFLDSGVELIELATNTHFFGNLYLSFGYHHRWLKQRWNNNAHVPLTFDTDDHQGFLTFVFGSVIKGRGNYSTLDINNRDEFYNYNSDNWALDYNYYQKVGKKHIRFLFGMRFAGVMGLAPSASSTYSSLALIY